MGVGSAGIGDTISEDEDKVIHRLAPHTQDDNNNQFAQDEKSIADSSTSFGLMTDGESNE